MRKMIQLDCAKCGVDRIDSTKGYVKGNIQFVAVMAQYAKHGFTEQELLEFCQRSG